MKHEGVLPVSFNNRSPVHGIAKPAHTRGERGAREMSDDQSELGEGEMGPRHAVFGPQVDSLRRFAK